MYDAKAAGVVPVATAATSTTTHQPISTASAKILYEEYHPYGTSAYRAAASGLEVNKRYRFNGKERDEETGLYYYGARYYAAWLARWTSADPLGIGADGPGVYNYVRGSPVVLIDPNGEEGQKAKEGVPNTVKDRVKRAKEIGREKAEERPKPEEKDKEPQPSPKPAPTPAPVPPPPPPAPKEAERKPIGQLRASERVVQWIKSQETFHNNPLALGATVAWGHKITTQRDLDRLEKMYGKGGRIAKTDKFAETLLREDINNLITDKIGGIAAKVKVPLAQHELDALVSLHYNAGLFDKKIRSKLVDDLNAGKSFREAAEHFFDRISTSEGQGGVETGKLAPSLGLLERRIGEVRIFLLGRYEIEGDELRALGLELLKERKAGTRLPAVDRALKLPAAKEFR